MARYVADGLFRFNLISIKCNGNVYPAQTL